MDCNILLFDKFETLDAFGPAEIFSRLSREYSMCYYSMQGGIVTSSQNIRVDTEAADVMRGGILLVPGGMGTRALVNDSAFLEKLVILAEGSEWILSVCTGSALLARAGLLNGKKATSNKMAFDWAVCTGADVNWIRQARWVVDGNIYTSSGVSAGMDMALGFISDRHGVETAEQAARSIEYIWNRDKNSDPFA